MTNHLDQTKASDDTLPDYEDVDIDENNLEDVHQFTDNYVPRDQMNDSDDVDLPESFEVAAHKYDIEPDIAKDQQHDFGPNRAFFGRHVVNSNTKRVDNLRHLMQMDLCDDYDLIPTRRQHANRIRQRVTAEYQACRSNQEIGGFDRKLQRSVLKKEDVDVKQQTTHNLPVKKKRTFLGFGGKK